MDASRPCPMCKSPVAVTGPTFPFCSPRCKVVDLGAWLEGRYRIAGESLEVSEQTPLSSDEPEA